MGHGMGWSVRFWMGFVWIRSYFRLKINISMTLGSFVLCFLKMWMLGVAASMTIAFLHYSIFTRGGGGVLTIMAYMGRLWPKGVPFSRLEVHESVGISLVTNIVYENVEKSVLSVYNWPKTANRCILWPWKAQEKFLVFWCIQTFKPVHLQPLKGM